MLSLCNFLEVEEEEIHKGNLNQPLLKLGSSPSSFREGSLYLVYLCLYQDIRLVRGISLFCCKRFLRVG
jgi:hypothetical protein